MMLNSIKKILEALTEKENLQRVYLLFVNEKNLKVISSFTQETLDSSFVFKNLDESLIYTSAKEIISKSIKFIEVEKNKYLQKTEINGYFLFFESKITEKISDFSVKFILETYLLFKNNSIQRIIDKINYPTIICDLNGKLNSLNTNFSLILFEKNVSLNNEIVEIFNSLCEKKCFNNFIEILNRDKLIINNFLTTSYTIESFEKECIKYYIIHLNAEIFRPNKAFFNNYLLNANFILNHKGEVIFLSDSVKAITGFDVMQVKLNKKLFLRNLSETSIRVLRKSKEIIESGNLFTNLINYTTPSGLPKMLLLKIRKFSDETVKNYFVGSIQEIESIEKPDKKISSNSDKENSFIQNEFNKRLLEANKLLEIKREAGNSKLDVLEEINSMKNDFISNISHELRTPLASIVGFAETISSDPDLPSEIVKEFNTIILEEGKRLSKLIDQVLDFSKAESNIDDRYFTKFDIIPALKTEIESFKSLAIENEIEILMEIPEAEIFIYGDIEKIKTVFSNLLSNAVKFNSKNGIINIIVNDFLKEVEIIFKDTGIGISKEDMPKLFQKFTKLNTSNEFTKGIGNGLFSAKRIIDFHKGIIQVRSQPKIGSSFIVRLPKIY